MLARRLIILGGKPSIAFPSTAILASATGGTAVGTATIRGKVKGTASWSLADSAGGKYAINSSTGAVTVNGALSAGTDSITIAVSGLTPAVKNASFSIGVVSAPVNSVAPAITGTSAVGFTLSCSTGTWSNNAYNTYSYQWKSAGSNVGTNSSTYVPVTGDAGNTITCTVTATNIAGNANATSSATSAVIGAPTNSVLPAISGSASPGQTVTVSTGTWTGSPSGYTYQWKLDGSPISGQTTNSYLVQAADDTHTLTCTVTATNIVGSASATSTGVVVSTFPSGALGVWYGNDYASSPRKYIPNSLNPITSPNILMDSGRRMSSSWGGSSTRTDYAATGVSGLTDASTLSGTGFWFGGQAIPAAPAGTYTLWATVKRNAASDQKFRLSLDASSFSSDFTATSSFQRFSYQFTHDGSAGHTLYIITAAGNIDAELIVDNIECFAGTTDQHTATRRGELLLTDTVTGSGGAIDVSGSSAYGQLQLPLETITTCSVVAIAKKVAAGGDHQSVLAKPQSFSDFAAYMELNISGRISDSFNFGGSSATGLAKNFCNYTGENFHGFGFRYDATNIQTWLDDFKLNDDTGGSSGLSFSLADLFVGNAFNEVTGYKIAAIALWDRALSDAEMRTAYSALATTTTQTMESTRLYVAEGDSITNGFLAPGGSYAALFGANSSPRIHGKNNSVNGSGLADLNSRAARLDATLPSSLGGRKAILSVDVGAGFTDLISGSYVGDTTAANYAADVLSYCQARLAAGWTDIVICTILPIDGNSTFNTRRALYNTIVRGWSNPHIHLSDFAADATMGPDAAAANTTYYADGTHPTDAGQAILETIIRPVINGI